MGRITIPLGKSFGRGRSTAPGMASMVNMYSEPVVGEGRTDIALYGTPGKALFASIGTTIRGQITASDVHYVVAGTRLYSVTSGGVTTDIGEIEGGLACDLSYNGNQIQIVADLKTYSYDTPSGVLSEETGGGFEQAISTASVASYSIVAVRNTGRFRWKLTNTATYDALDFATAEAESDKLVAVRKVGNEIALLGTATTEFWGPTGDAGADAFARTATASASIGCVSRDSAITVDNALTWVGRDGRAGGVSVYRAEGYSPRKISTPQVDGYLETVADLTTIRAFSYQQRGHLFYILTAPNEWTLAWDVSTNLWSYRKSGTWSMGAEPLGGWDANTYTLNGSKQIVGASDGNLYELQADTLTENGTGIVREVTTPQISDSGRRMFMSRLELQIEAGVGLEDGTAPIVMESHSDDGGKTWSDARNAGMGPIGENTWRAVWHAMGSFRQRIIKFRVSDSVDVVFLTAHADVTTGST